MESNSQSNSRLNVAQQVGQQQPAQQVAGQLRPHLGRLQPVGHLGATNGRTSAQRVMVWHERDAGCAGPAAPNASWQPPASGPPANVGRQLATCVHLASQPVHTITQRRGQQAVVCCATHSMHRVHSAPAASRQMLRWRWWAWGCPRHTCGKTMHTCECTSVRQASALCAWHVG